MGKYDGSAADRLAYPENVQKVLCPVVIQEVNTMDKKWTRYTMAQRKQVIEAFYNGMTYRQIQEKYCVNYSTACRWVKQEFLQKRRKTGWIIQNTGILTGYTFMYAGMVITRIFVLRT